MNDKIYEALAYPTRREILRLLRDGDHATPGEIAETLDIPKPTLSGHLGILKNAGLVIGERQGTTIRYRIDTSIFEDLLEELHGLAYQEGGYALQKLLW
ncbi:metalloregulator ArsR/SmtB family transcription factor [Nocardiopsis rhodophaea]|uniref:metalloregulator ArsR/SmtB family transcription factor n=1 Tax=Nocardiopsis rhodophaea TaxID=280238 RepID=UPI0031D52058